MNFHIEYEREADGRWLAEVPEIPGVLTYGATADEAMAKAETLALRALATLFGIAPPFCYDALKRPSYEFKLHRSN